MKAQEVYDRIKHRFPDKTILLQVQFWDHRTSGKKTKNYLIDVHGINPNEPHGQIMDGRGESWEKAYYSFCANCQSFALESQVVSLNKIYAEQF